MPRKMTLAVNLHPLQEEEDSYLEDMRRLQPMERIALITQLRQTFYSTDAKAGQISRVVGRAVVTDKSEA